MMSDVARQHLTRVLFSYINSKHLNAMAIGHHYNAVLKAGLYRCLVIPTSDNIYHPSVGEQLPQHYQMILTDSRAIVP